MPTLFLAALFASALNPARAWSDRAGWESAVGAELAGVDGTAAATTTVRALWNDQWLFFEFVCRDDAAVASGLADGADHFKVGDVVEVFVGKRGEPSYLEVHATPDGRKTVYAFQSYRRAAPAPNDAEIKAGPVEGGWRTVMAIPWSSLGGKPNNESWEFLAGRYDYDESGSRPVLSSFPAQSGKPDFHKRSRYAVLQLQP